MQLPRLPFREDKVFSALMLLVLVVPLIFNWQLYEKFEIIKISVWMLLLGIAIFASIGQKPLFKAGKKFTFTIFCFLIFGFLASIFSVDRLNSFFGFYPRFTSGFLFYILWAATLLMLVLYTNTDRWKFLIKVIFFDAIIIGIFGILQSFGIGYYEGVTQAAISRAPGLLGNPNFSSMFLASVLPFTLPLLAEAKIFYSKLYYALGAFFMFWAIINFSSRGAWLALIFGLLIGLGIVSFLRISKKSIIVFSAVILFCIGFIASFVQVTRPGSITSLLMLKDSNMELRLFSWDVARKAIVSNPIFGFGPGNLQIYFEQHRDTNLATQSGVFDDAHNIFIQMAATTGLPFTFLFIGILSFCLWAGYKNLRVGENSLWAAGGIMALVVWIIASCFSPVSSANFLLLAVILTGLYLGKGESSGGNKPFFLKIGLAICAFVFVSAGVIFAASEFIFFKAYNNFYGQNFSESLKFSKLAIKLNPTNQLYYLYNIADKIILGQENKNLQNEIEKLIKIHPQSAKSQVMAANLSYLLYDKTKEREYLKNSVNYMNESLKLDKFYAPRYTHAAFYIAEDGDLPLAREYLKTALTFDSKNLPAWLLLARVYQLEEKFPQMQYALSQAFKTNPTDEYLKSLNEASKQTKDFKNLQIPALINTYQIEP